MRNALGAEKKFETIIQTRPDRRRTMLAVSWSTKRGLLEGSKESEGTATKMIRLRARPKAWTSYMSSRQYLRSCRRDLVERRSASIWEQEIPDSVSGQTAISNAGRNDQCDQRDRMCAEAAHQNSLDRNRRIEFHRDISCQSSTAIFVRFSCVRHIRAIHDQILWSLQKSYKYHSIH